MPALTGFTVNEGIFFHIKSNFLPYFLLIYRLEQRWNASACHIHIPEQQNPVKQSEFDSTDVSTAQSLFRRPCSVVSDPHARATDRFGLDEMKESSDCIPTVLWFWNVHQDKVIGQQQKRLYVASITHNLSVYTCTVTVGTEIS